MAREPAIRSEVADGILPRHIRTCGLKKQFDHYIAVYNLDLQVESGGIYGSICEMSSNLASSRQLVVYPSTGQSRQLRRVNYAASITQC